MRFSSLIVMLATAVTSLVSIAQACDPKTQDCCWGGNDGGYNGCDNQHVIQGYGPKGNIKDLCKRSDYVAQYCSNNGVTTAQCNADCCSVSKKVGIKCP